MARMELRDQDNNAIAGGANHLISKYSSKVPEFLHASEKTLGNTTAEWRFGDKEDYIVSFRITTQSKSFYEIIIGYHQNGTQFRLNSSLDLGNLMLKTRAGQCEFNRMQISTYDVTYEMTLTCSIIEEGI